MNSSIVSNLVLCDEEVKLFNISLDNQEADNNNGGTATIYEKYGVGIYKDSNATNNLMTATSNNISVPLKVGYTFGGYYSKVNGTGDNLINNSGFITDKFTNTYFREDSKIYAKWNINNYTMNVNASNGISKFNVSASDGTSSNNVNSYSQSKPYRTEFTVNNVTSKTGYTYSGYTLNDKLSELSDSSKNTIKVKLGAGTGVLTLNSSTNIYNINYNLNSGIAGSSAPKSGTYDKVINISNPSRSGYTFTGWTASFINTSTALYGKTSSTVTNNWSSGTTKVTDSYFKNLNPINNSTVTLNATWHDSTKPVCTINTPNDIIYQSTVNVKVTCTDNDSLKSNTLSADNFTISNGTIASVQNVSNVSAVNSKQHEYILTIKGLNVGNYTISLKENSVYDTSGNGNAVATSGTGKVVAKSITDSMVSINPTTFVYDGNNKQPTVSVVDGSTTLILNTNYTLSYSNNINVGTGKVTITGTGNYTGTVTKTFTITAKSIGVPTCSTKTYTGVSQTLLSNGTGYIVSGTTTGIDAGTYSVTVTPTGNYQWSDNTTSSKSVSCKIDKKSISVTWGGTTSFTYNGSAQAPTVTTPVTGVNGENVNITRTTQTNVGSYTSTASCSSVSGGRAKCSNYNLTNNTKSFTINKKSIGVPSCSTKTYTGVSQTLLSNGTGYTVSGTTTGIDAGTYSVTVTPTGNYQWSDNTTSSKSVSCKIDKKSISVTWGGTTSFTYNGSAQAPTVTTPVTGVNGENVNITRTTQTNVGSYTSTASCSSVSGGQAKCSNYSLNNATKAYTISYNTFNITLDTNKPSPLNAGYYTDGTNTIYMRYHDGVYLDSNYSNKMSSSSNKITVPTATGYDFLGYYDGDIIMINSTGEISSNFTNTTYSGAKTLTAKWKRNFACNDSTTIGSNISYSGKNWTVVTKNEWSCQLVLNEQSSATGSYNDASSKLTSEYLSSGGISGNKTLYNEMQAGLLFTVNGNYYADTNGGKTNINGLYWYDSGKVWDSTARTQYKISSTYKIYFGSYQVSGSLLCSDGECYDGSRIKTANAVSNSTVNAGTRSVSNTSANYTLNNGKSTPSVVTGSANNRFSRSYNIFRAEPKSTNSFVLRKDDMGDVSDSYTNTNWRVRFYPCGGDSNYSGHLAWRYTAKSKTAVTFENVITGKSYSDGASRLLLMASRSTSTTENKTNGVLRTYNNYSSAHCKTFNTYTLSNVNYPIHYRLHIDVKRYS